MKAIVLDNAGGVKNLLAREIDKPNVGSNDVLIATKAVSINPVDYKVRANEEILSMIYGEERPAILGWDVAGTVVACGDKVNQFNIGDHVFGMVNFPGKGNAYAEYVLSPENHLAKMPDGISFKEAAATTLAALTALQALETRVKKGDKVLIHAGSGGVGHFAIQIAKAMGAYVVSTSSAKNREFVMSVGADKHIDYRTQAFEETVSDVDFVLDGMGGETLLKSIKVLKKEGVIISLPTPEFSEEVVSAAKSKNADVSFLLVQSNGTDMKTLSDMIQSGKIKAHVSQSYSFDQMEDAHLHLESGRTVGKVVVTI
jgi:2-desacetyl-2-hydroxyethyl bacteriochlorophyllide A dehydrogenase